MNTNTQSPHYQLPKKSVKIDCPECGPTHRKTLSRYVDTRTGELFPEIYGRCDRESNCGYHLSPYHKGPSGKSFANEQKAPPLPKEWFRMAGKLKRHRINPESIVDVLVKKGATPEQAERVLKYVFRERSLSPLSPPKQVYSIPDEFFTRSLGRYNENQLARLLSQQFGPGKANELLQRFHVGTSARWPGASVFWYIDESGRKRGGQIKLFGSDWHTAKKPNGKGKVDWVHSALTYRLEKAGTILPDWLTDYNQHGERCPCLFGLPQLATAPIDIPVSVVESPKTAVVCSALIPAFVWLAVGALSYLNAERLAPVRGRKLILYPDLNGFARWSNVADDLNKRGFQITVSDFLEERANDEQKRDGLDLADYLLQQPPTVSDPAPPNEVPEFWDACQTIQATPNDPRIEWVDNRPVEPYRVEFDGADPPDAVPKIHEIPVRDSAGFFRWQRDSPPFNAMGLASLKKPRPP